MKQHFTRLLFVLTVFITAEFVGTNSVVVYSDELADIAKTEWIDTNELPLVFEQTFFEKKTDQHEGNSQKAIFDKILFFPFQASCYKEKLQLNDGYAFVFSRGSRSNIPHLNQDDEDPAFILG